MKCEGMIDWADGPVDRVSLVEHGSRVVNKDIYFGEVQCHNTIIAGHVAPQQGHITLDLALRLLPSFLISADHEDLCSKFSELLRRVKPEARIRSSHSDSESTQVLWKLLKGRNVLLIPRAAEAEWVEDFV